MHYLFIIWLMIGIGLLWHGCRVPTSLSIHFSVIFFMMTILAYWNLDAWVQILGGIIIGFLLIITNAIA